MALLDITPYVKSLSLVASDGFENFADPRWDYPLSLVTQEILDQAFEKQPSLNMIFNDNAIPFVSRTSPKSLARVEEKVLQGINSFKILADFLCGRIQVTVSEIDGMISRLGQLFTRRHAKFKLTDTTPDESLDIVRFAYAYDTSLGEVIELQIGDAGAFDTFDRDSLLRDDPMERRHKADLRKYDIYPDYVKLNFTPDDMDLEDKIKAGLDKLEHAFPDDSIIPDFRKHVHRVAAVGRSLVCKRNAELDSPPIQLELDIRHNCLVKRTCLIEDNTPH